MAVAQTLYWHDYETSGIDVRRDRPVQFAGIRTDLDLNIIGEPLQVYCKLPRDVLPSPEACLLTGITPDLTQQQGLIEPDFIQQIHHELSQPNTIGVGYNSLRFDDEITRFCLYRNFYDPYEREWQNGCGRWDIIDMVRLCRALRPAGIHWPDNEAGLPSFRLEVLTAANGIEHTEAHQAISDVYATIALAKLIKDKQPRLYDFAFGIRKKQAAAVYLDTLNKTPVLHASRMFLSKYCGVSVVMPIMSHPTNSNGVIVVDLRHDPQCLIDEDVETLEQRLYSTTKLLEEAGLTRPAIKTVHINKCPMLAPLKSLDVEARERTQIDLDLCQRHEQLIRDNEKIILVKLMKLFSTVRERQEDAELALYGGFIPNADKQRMRYLRQTPPQELSLLEGQFEDPRLNTLFFRYRARHWPELLSPDEQERWLDFCRAKLCGEDDNVMTIARFKAEVDALADSEHTRPIKQALLAYLADIKLNL